MNRLCKAISCIALVLAAAATGTKGNCQSFDDIQRLFPGVVADGVLAYIYGYPLMMFGVTGRTATTVANGTTKLGGAPLNQFGKESRLPDYTFTAVVLPSSSTLYASSFLNLCNEPVIMHIPNMNGRFFIMQVLDGWTEVSRDSPGSNKNDGDGGDYALVGPPCEGHTTPPIPGTVRKIVSIPTSSMWIIGRIYTSGTDKDLAYVTGPLFKQFTLTPLSKYNAGQPANLDDQPVQPFADTVTSPLNQVAAMDACAFFQNLAAMLNFNLPIPIQDDPVLPALLRVGVVTKNQNGAIVGTNFDCTTLRPDKLASLQKAVTLAQKLLTSVNATQPGSTGWVVSLDVGSYGRQYFLRAEVAQDALGANLAQDAVYGYTKTDGNQTPLTGRRNYKIHFAPPGNNQGGIPPVVPGGFWSVTIYDLDGKLIKPPDTTNANWNAVGMPPVNGHKACPNNDHSLDLYLQASAPGAVGSQQFCNWLPTPSSGGYIVFLRMYWPDTPITSGQYVPPPITKN
jgi:DNA sulfur modification protein DndE